MFAMGKEFSGLQDKKHLGAAKLLMWEILCIWRCLLTQFSIGCKWP